MEITSIERKQYQTMYVQIRNSVDKFWSDGSFVKAINLVL